MSAEMAPVQGTMTNRSLRLAPVLPALLAEKAVTEPSRVFLREVGGSDTTFEGLDLAVRRWSGALASVGVTGGDVVALMLPTSAVAVEIWLACAWLRANELSINTSYRGRMLKHVLEDSGARFVIIHQRFVEEVRDVLEAVDSLDVVVVLGDAQAVDRLSLEVPRVNPSDDLLEAASEYRPGEDPEYWDTASIVYTSGTTGESKGVMVPWGQMATQPSLYPLDELTEGARYSPFPLYHVSGKSSVYLQAMTGNPVVLRDGFSTSAFWPEVRRYECVSTTLIGTMATFLMNQARHRDDQTNPLRVVMMLPLIADVEDFESRFQLRVITCYGMTEVGWPISAVERSNTVSCGRVREGYEARVVDEHDEPLGPQEVGELVVRSSVPWTMMQGYLNRPDATLEAWRNGWFHTGDAFTYDNEGEFYFVDRLKDAIRRRGENISSREVEDHVLQHPDIGAVAAFGVPSEHGEEEVEVAVVPRPGSEIDPMQLIEFLAPLMPRFMLPRFVVVLETLPRTDTGKVNKQILRDQDPAGRWDREAT